MGFKRTTTMKKLYIPYNSKLIEPARRNRVKQTEAEEKMWNEVLKNRQLKNYKFLRQKPIENFIADFYCAELMLVIEIDGGLHLKQKERDLLRSERLQDYGVKVLRYTNDEVMLNINKVRKDLENKVDKMVGVRSSPSLIREGVGGGF